MVYGSFLAIVFVLLLMWTDTTRGGSDLRVTHNFLWGGFVVVTGVILVLTNLTSWDI